MDIYKMIDSLIIRRYLIKDYILRLLFVDGERILAEGKIKAKGPSSHFTKCQ
jgi:hypothetical protein